MLRKRAPQDPGSSRPEDTQAGKLLSGTTASYSREIGEAMIKKNFSEWVRRVVQEEIERVTQNPTSSLRSPQQQTIPIPIPAVESSGLQLVFCNPLPPSIFTMSDIEDAYGNPLQIFLTDSSKSQLAQLPLPIKILLHVLDGGFPGDRHDWTTDEFMDGIVKERTGKRPLLIGNVQGTLKDGLIPINELRFTDNSSWIKCGKFRIGARVDPGNSYNGPRIREAVSEAFRVKDHRGRTYKKHYPPSLEDNVWRLEGIHKGGAFHKKLRNEGINTVEDFLKLWAVDPSHLRSILGVGMSDRMWKVTINHAGKCLLGVKRYLYGKDSRGTIILNAICQVMEIHLNGVMYTPNQLNAQQQIIKQELAREARQNWDAVEEADGLLLIGNTSLLQSRMNLQGMIESPSSGWPDYQGHIMPEFQIADLDDAGNPTAG